MDLDFDDENYVKRITMPRWVLAFIVAISIMQSSQIMLPVGLGLFTFLFNVSNGKLIEGILVGLFAAATMLFFMQIATVRRLHESNELKLFLVNAKAHSSVTRLIFKCLAWHYQDR
jgi:hypothetical protein